jgi:opacity protein-like surface antigen
MSLSLKIAVAVVLLASATAAQAQDWPRVNVLGGVQVADFGTDVELEGETDVFDETIDFENVLGFHETSSVAWASGLWRISRRNQVEIVWSRVDRDVSHHQLPVDIAFGDQMFDTNTDVDAFFDTWFIGASYRFAIVANPVVEFGPSLGLVAMHLSTGIGVSESDAGTGSDATEMQEASFTAPAVLPGGFINVRAHPRLLLHARAGYISADFGPINGEVVQVQAGADFMFTRSLGVGVSYSHNRLSLSVDDDDFRGNVRFSFSGPQVYAVLGF